MGAFSTASRQASRTAPMTCPDRRPWEVDPAWVTAIHKQTPETTRKRTGWRQVHTAHGALPRIGTTPKDSPRTSNGLHALHHQADAPHGLPTQGPSQGRQLEARNDGASELPWPLFHRHGRGGLRPCIVPVCLLPLLPSLARSAPWTAQGQRRQAAGQATATTTRARTQRHWRTANDTVGEPQGRQGNPCQRGAHRQQTAAHLLGAKGAA